MDNLISICTPYGTFAATISTYEWDSQLGSWRYSLVIETEGDSPSPSTDTEK